MTLILEAEQSLAILKVVAEKNTRIKQLEAEFNICEKLLDETREDLYKEQAENQRLREAINKLIEEYNHETFSIKDLLKLRTREGL